MKKVYFLLAALAGLVFLANTSRGPRTQYGMVVGTPEIRSISGLAFGPDGVLLVAIPKVRRFSRSTPATQLPIRMHNLLK